MSSRLLREKRRSTHGSAWAPRRIRYWLEWVPVLGRLPSRTPVRHGRGPSRSSPPSSPTSSTESCSPSLRALAARPRSTTGPGSRSTSRSTSRSGRAKEKLAVKVVVRVNSPPPRVLRGLKTLKNAYASLQVADQALVSTAPGSHGRRRARSRLAQAHRQVANTRRHLDHLASMSLVDRCQVLVLEDVNVAGIVRNRRPPRSISGAARRALAPTPPQGEVARGRRPSN